MFQVQHYLEERIEFLLEDAKKQLTGTFKNYQTIRSSRIEKAGFQTRGKGKGNEMYQSRDFFASSWGSDRFFFLGWYTCFHFFLKP